MYEELIALDDIRLNFSQSGLLILNMAVGFIMFGVALNIKLSQLRDVLKNPRHILIGLLSQYILLPLLTFVFILLIQDVITPSVAFGMILVAACPGGTISNFITNYAHANTALSISLTAFATLLSVVMTPFNFAFYGKWYSATSPLLQPLEIDAWQMIQSVMILLGIPVMLGLFFNAKFPEIAHKIKGPIKNISICLFGAMVLIAFFNNWEYFIRYIKWILIIVFFHHLIALASGYYIGRIFKMSKNDSRTLSIETGIQNSGLALAMIFNPAIFPTELKIGGMAFIIGWWGIWHIVAGLSIATYWSKHPPKL